MKSCFQRNHSFDIGLDLKNFHYKFDDFYFVFVIFLLILSSFVGFLFFRDWIKYRRLSPRNVRKHLKKAKKHIALKEWEEAEKVLIPIYENGLGGCDLWILYSLVLRGTFRFEEAARFISYGLKQHPEDLRFNQEQGRLLLALGKPHEALFHIEKCRTILRVKEDVFDLALAHFQTGNFSEVAALLAPFTLSSTDEKTLSLRADALIELKLYQEAIVLYEKAIQAHGQKNYLIKKLALCYGKMGFLDQSISLYRKVLEKEENDIEALLGLGNCYQEAGYYLKALLLYQSHKNWKGDARLVMQVGICALHSKRFELSEACFRQVIEKWGISSELLSFYGYSFECQQKWERAQEIYFDMINRYPTLPHGWRALAWLFGVGFSTIINAKEGVAIARKAVELLPDSLSWELLSACEARAGNFSLAHQIQEELLNKDNDSTSRARRQEVMRTLRKHLPLEDNLIPRSLVA